jgi:DNA primase
MPDGDEPGERCAEAVLKLVSPHRAVRWVTLERGEQPTDLTADELAALVP